MINKKIVKVSILGPKPYSLGGHDYQNHIYSHIKTQIREVLNQFHRNDKIVIGLTGLSLGLEQEFANICKQQGITYNVYLSHDNPTKSWEDLPNVIMQYHNMLQTSNTSIDVSNGSYSPKKCLQRQLRILKDSDCVIYVSGFLPIKNDKIQAMLNTKQTIIIPFNINV